MTTADRPLHPDDDAAVRGPYARWERSVVWWDVAFYTILALGTAALLLSGEEVRSEPVAVAAVVVIALSYALLGSRAARDRSVVAGRVYVVVLIAATTVLVAQGGLGTFVLFVAFTHVWLVAPTLREGIFFSAILAASATVGIAWAEGRGLARDVLLEVVPQMGVALVFAVGVGLWVTLTMRHSEGNARLLDELEVAQAELAATQHAAGVAAERERLAREIHDTLAQGFMSVVTHAQAATAALDRGEAASVRERLETMEATARDNLAEARALVAAFAPVPLQGATLAEALQRLARRFTEETGIVVQVVVAPAADTAEAPTAAADVVLLRAAQEALANVRRHAGADAVTLRLVRDRDAIELEVADDGRGLPTGHEEGFGLAGMRERAAAAGGSLDVGSAPGGGTTVRVRLPAAGAT